MSGLFGKTPKPPPATPMVDEEALKRAKKRGVERVRNSGGRESTILGEMGGSDKLGG